MQTIGLEPNLANENIDVKGTILAFSPCAWTLDHLDCKNVVQRAWWDLNEHDVKVRLKVTDKFKKKRKFLNEYRNQEAIGNKLQKSRTLQLGYTNVNLRKLGRSWWRTFFELGLKFKSFFFLVFKNPCHVYSNFFCFLWGRSPLKLLAPYLVLQAVGNVLRIYIFVVPIFLFFLFKKKEKMHIGLETLLFYFFIKEAIYILKKCFFFNKTFLLFLSHFEAYRKQHRLFVNSFFWPSEGVYHLTMRGAFVTQKHQGIKSKNCIHFSL